MLYLILFLFMVVCAGLAAITVLNLTTQVQLSLYFWQSPSLPVGFWLMAAFFLGALLLYFVSVNSALSERREMKALRRRLEEVEQRSTSPSLTSGSLMPMPGMRQPTGDLPPQNFR